MIPNLRAGLARSVPADKVAVENNVSTLLARLRNLQTYLTRHWRQGVVGVGLVLFTSLLSFPQPLVYRFLVDDVMLARRLDLLSLAILLKEVGYLLSRISSDVLGLRWFFS